MILCGWCGVATEDTSSCVSCGRDPAKPYVQRGTVPTPADPRADDRRRLARAERELRPGATIAQLAEHLGVSDRTVRRWRETSAPRPSTPLVTD